MAASRPGWSRRAQYGLFFSFIAAIVAVAIGLILLAISIAAPQRFNNLRGLALDATAPITNSLHAVSATVGGLASGAGDYWDAAHQNDQLKRENAALRQQITEARAILLDNRELRATLRLREETPHTIAIGRIVSSSFESPRRFAILAAGKRDGIDEGMPVRSAKGLIGRVLQAGTLNSRVLLVSDRASTVPARLLTSGQAVLCQGRGDGTLEIKPLEVGRNPFKPGDVVVTSGVGGLYPPLIPLARVVRLLGDGAIAVPLADIGSTTVAMVEQPYEVEASAAAPVVADQGPIP
ncbi:rod shape-determining protein MreC [Sphingomonas sp. RG327]|uniref:Cell shape-determining protein MreC n=1 Tax=Sphingomonas anseongensis TaxID=2908207 RepID=A0ABT0RCZ6_9SPHN|nr:rod shape-determining protein MreC [Sphingomonas anseongensis]